MSKPELEKIVRQEYERFQKEFKITDFPTVTHVLAMVQTESQWNPNADSGFQRGLMQVSEQALQTINRIYGTNFTYQDMFDPEKNQFVGIRYMRWLYRYFTNNLKLPSEIQVPLSIMQYNWGIGNVTNWLTKTKKCNSVIDEVVPEETKSHLLNWLFWCAVFK